MQDHLGLCPTPYFRGALFPSFPLLMPIVTNAAAVPGALAAGFCPWARGSCSTIPFTRGTFPVLFCFFIQHFPILYTNSWGSCSSPRGRHSGEFHHILFKTNSFIYF